METSAAVEEFITIVPVGESKPAEKDPAFVTVLTVGEATGAAEVVICRPRGARLGLGLKFEGGSAAAEKVRRLLVQSCAEDSPAANAITPWGKLIPGDEILAIDGISVSELTRIDCVRRLKDSDEKLTLLVRHFELEDKVNQNKMDVSETVIQMKQTVDIGRPTTLPPPVPPRKLGKKNSFKDKPTLQTVGEQNALINIDELKSPQTDKETVINGQHAGIPSMNKLSRKSSFDSHIHRQNKEGIAYLKKGSPEEVRRLVRRLSDGKNIPPEAEVYIDLLSNEWERCLVFADAESDDTGSSISTVVDRLGSMTSSVENSIPSTPIMPQKSIDIQKVLNCIENIDTNILRDMAGTKFLERQMDINNECKKLEKSSATNGFANHESVIQNNHSEEAILQPKKAQTNDKNNNHTVTQNNTLKLETNESCQTIEKTITKQEVGTDKPKPLPRNAKIDRTTSEKKRKPIPTPETLTPAAPELLTATKKNCIETWLQRSEAEMNNKIDDKFEDVSIPEILPRLIDFVPKNQFKENAESSTCSRPTAPPPPPPAETREDGSGASLDTIGELDESTDVIDSTKSTLATDNIKRKSSFERSFWDDRVNKSDAEDKSLSNDETPLPTCPRQPPDGVETPADAIEKTPDLPTRLPPRLPVSWLNTRPRFSYVSRTQDARSEASVKDKIAMFSSDASSSDRLDKCGTLPTRTHSTLRKSSTPYINSYTDVSSLDRRLTKSQDNLDETPRSYKRRSERPEVLGALEHTVTDTTADRYIKSDIINKPLFYGSTITLPTCSDPSFARPTYHARSVSDDNSNKNIAAHKSNLEYLIEQRKKSMSKLRGLVIPEVHTPIVDLPEIKVQDSLSKSFLQKFNQNNIIKKESKTNVVTKPIILSDTKWKTGFLPNNLPKYSPAFKRKSLQVYTPTSFSKESTPERRLNDKTDSTCKISNKTILSPSLRSSLEPSKLLLSNTNTIKDFNKRNLSDIHEYKNVEIKICTATEIVDSDNDSAMSSTQSSYRSSASSPMQNIDNVESDNSRLSPRIPHYGSYALIKNNIHNKSCSLEKHGEDYMKRNVCRSVSSDTNISLSSSAGSAATSGSQASCSSLESSVADSDKRKVSRTYNIDTINRRNILASAKCRSGRDLKLKSPVVETKFSHESYDRSPSPTHKTSERLSTLTSSVSAIANKGDTRRRNKVIADSDSDSDNDVNIRQRKTDYKNTRLKRNSSNSSKNKQNETDSIKMEDAPIYIKDKIIMEMNKAGLEALNANNNKMSSSVIKNNVELCRTDMTSTNKKDLNSNINHKYNDTLDITKSIEITKVREYSGAVKDESAKDLSASVKLATQLIKLKRGVGTGVGLILAGGVDCEAKDVTVHRVLAGSVAAKAGLKRGAKIRSINGSAMLGLTHAQSVSILKEQRSEVIIEVIEETQDPVIDNQNGSEIAESKDCQVEELKLNKKDKNANKSIVTVLLEKAGGGAGLGFGLDGGRDSPNGDRPLTIKKLFAGGAAAQSGRVLVGAELLSAGGQSMEGLTRTQAWAALKALPAGQVALVLRNNTTTE